jgi:hypothetical protein
MKPLPSPARRIAAFGAACALALLAGCSTIQEFPAKVTVFSEWKPLSPMSYQFVRTEQQQQSLEHKTYEQAVREVLASKGFVEAEPGARTAAKYKVALSYGVIEEQPLREIYYDDPWWPAWRANLWVGRGFYSPYYYPYPWAVGGTWARAYDVPRYARELRIDISDAASGAKLYEATARNESFSSTLAPAVPYLARAVMEEFPQANGSTRMVKLPVAQPQ